MTSSFPGDSMTSLHPDDLFMVNRDVDSNGNYETYKVPYSEVAKVTKGATGPEGATGDQGATGNQGPMGSGVKVLGYFATYAELVEYANATITANPDGIQEGDMYVVGNDYEASVNQPHGTPGLSFCKAGAAIDSTNCKINVAYVWAIAAGPGQTDIFVRIAQLTGDKGATGPNYDSVGGGAEDNTGSGGKYDYVVKFRDTQDYSQDPQGAVKLPDVDLTIEDIQGATGATGPYFDTIYTSVDTIEGDGVTLGGTPKFKKTYKFKIDRSFASDPDNKLTVFESGNLVGATGPGVGEPGATGPSFTKVEHREGAEETDPNDPLLTYTKVFTDYIDETGVLKTQVGDVNVKGPRGPAGPPMDADAFKELLLEIFPPDGDKDDDAPWVHRGATCDGGVDNIDEPIYGTKTFKKTLKFAPCKLDQEIIRWDVGSNRDFRMFFKKGLRGSVTLDGFSIQRDNTNSPGLTVGFEQNSGSPQIGIKVATPMYALDAKGVVAAQQCIARQNPGQPVTSGNFAALRTTGLESGTENFGFRQSPDKSGPCRFQFTGNARLEYYGQPGGFKIQKSKLYTNKGGFLRLDGDQVKYSATSTFRTPSISDVNTTVAAEFDGSRALEVVKSLKPRIVTTEDGNVIISPVKEDIETGIMNELKRTAEGETSMETVVSMLLLSIQKLEQRITALESA